MARRKSPEDVEWDNIFNNLSFDTEPHHKYIKQAVIKTKTGKRFKLNGLEFSSIMEQERNMDPADAMVESCKVTLDFQKIKTDVTRFAVQSLAKSARRHRKSTAQHRFTRALKALQNSTKLSSKAN
jgi:hypothetical protein